MKKLQATSKSLSKFSLYLEYVIASILILAIIIQGCKLFIGLKDIYFSNLNDETLTQFLSYSFTLVIVLEFVRMLIKHSMENVTEVLVFTIARKIIVDHVTDFSLLISILCIIALLASRKYLLVKQDW